MLNRGTWRWRRNLLIVNGLQKKCKNNKKNVKKTWNSQESFVSLLCNKK